jgi:hypothetical protein
MDNCTLAFRWFWVCVTLVCWKSTYSIVTVNLVILQYTSPLRQLNDWFVLRVNTGSPSSLSVSETLVLKRWFCCQYLIMRDHTVGFRSLFFGLSASIFTAFLMLHDGGWPTDIVSSLKPKHSFSSLPGNIFFYDLFIQVIVSFIISHALISHMTFNSVCFLKVFQMSCSMVPVYYVPLQFYGTVVTNLVALRHCKIKYFSEIQLMYNVAELDCTPSSSVMLFHEVAIKTSCKRNQ